MIAFSPTPRSAEMPARLAPLRLVPALPAGGGARVLPSTYRRRQALAAGLVATVVAVTSAVLGSLGDGSRSVPGSSPADREVVSYVVQPGDTLWSIATALDPEGDPRPLVERLAFDHGGPQLQAGEEISVPRV